MKISINSTYSYIRTNINYGSTLQCYALQKYLKKRGHDPEHLRDYRANPVLILKRLKNIKWFKPFCAKAVAQFEMGRFIKDNIFTNTYHGMLFCIIFKKQFLFFVQKGSGAAENDRFYSLMSMLHLEDRMVTSGDTACISEKMKRPIDYEKVYSVIRSERLRTDAFFEKYGM